MKKAIILFNLGGPDKLENVQPFLFNLFNDPAILSLPTFLRFPLASFSSEYIVNPFTLVLNFFGLTKLSKKSTFEVLIKDLDLFCASGTIYVVNNNCSKVSKKENLIKKFINSIFCTPKFQKIINSLFASYLIVT